MNCICNQKQRLWLHAYPILSLGRQCTIANLFPRPHIVSYPPRGQQHSSCFSFNLIHLVQLQTGGVVCGKWKTNWIQVIELPSDNHWRVNSLFIENLSDMNVGTHQFKLHNLISGFKFKVETTFNIPIFIYFLILIKYVLTYSKLSQQSNKDSFLQSISYKALR